MKIEHGVESNKSGMSGVKLSGKVQQQKQNKQSINDSLESAPSIDIKEKATMRRE
jgi:hypothetical protein